MSLGELFANSFESEDGLFNYYIGGNDPQINFLDSLVIDGKTFYSLSMNDSQVVPNLEIKYSLNEGVIYIKDPQELQ